MSFLSLGGTIFLTGLLYSVSAAIFEWVDEKFTLQLAATLTLLGLYFLSKIKGAENRSKPIPLSKIRQGYDWNIIFKAIVPSFLIAIGAGFHHSGHQFVLSTMCTEFLLKCSPFWGPQPGRLVIVVMLLMPSIRRRFGYRVAITLVSVLFGT